MYKLGHLEGDTNGLLTHEDKDELDAMTLEEVVASFKALDTGTCFSKGSSAYRGVSWHKEKGKWEAQIRVPGGKRVYLGLFLDEEAAARAYDQATFYVHGR